MKRLVCFLMVLAMLVCGVAHAAASKKLFDDVQIGPTGTLQTSDAISTRDFKKMSFFVDFDETGTVQGTFTTEVSWDKSTWYLMPITQANKTTPLQPSVDTPDTSIVMTADTKVVAFFDEKLAAPWVRVKLSPEDTDGTNWIYVTVDFVGIQ